MELAYNLTFVPLVALVNDLFLFVFFFSPSSVLVSIAVFFY